MSRLTWLDYSDRERRKVMEVVELFREEDTRDELGIGTIRDTLSNQLFPGTSTIQTRLRYFFFVPWVLGELENKRIPSARAADRSRRMQGKLCDALKAGKDSDGIIGVLAGHNVQRLPGNVYWSGLGAWGIRLYQGSEAAYYGSLDTFYERRRTNRGSVDELTGKEADLHNWDPELPHPPDGFLEAVDFALTEEEADYLVDRIRRRGPDSLLRDLVDRGATVTEHVSFPWEHPATKDLPSTSNKVLEHAHNFSQLVLGAALLYNLILAEHTEWEEKIEEYRSRLAAWWNGTLKRESAFAAWKQEELWAFLANSGGRITTPTLSFVDAWRDGFQCSGRLETLIDAPQMRNLITQRERRLKGKRARIGDPRAKETWSGASGTGQLDFRWNRPVAGYLNDLHAAFSNGGRHA